MKSNHTGLLIVFIGLILFFAGCTGKTGDPGPAGNNGANGATGPGFDRAVKYGNILLYLNGKTPNGDAFQDTLDFKFSSGNLNESEFQSFAADDKSYYLKRFLVLDDYSTNGSIEPDLRITVSGVDTVYRFECTLNTTVTTSDFKYFTFNNWFYNTDGSNFTNEHFDGFVHDPSKGHLYYRFGFTVDAGSNSTGYPLDVDGIVNTTVYEYDGD
jgi:hypothetical protein